MHKMADDLESCSEENQDKRNEFYEEWFKQIQKDPFNRDVEFEILNDEYFKRSEELRKESEERAQKVFAEIGKHFYSLWD